MKKKIALLLTAALLLFSGCDTSGEEPNNETDSTNAHVSENGGTNAPSSENTDTENTSQANNYQPPEGTTMLKWGVNNGISTFSQSRVSEFNEALHNYGCDFGVEFVNLYREQLEDSDTCTFDIEQAITDYEKSNGRLDIIDLAFTQGAIGIRGGLAHEGIECELVSKGLLEPLDMNAIMPDSPFPNEILNMGRVGDNVYVLPSYGITLPNAFSIYVNTDYVSEDKLSDYDGSFKGLVDILSELPEQDSSVCALEVSQTFYESSSVCSEYDFIHSLVLDYKTKKAVNPFEQQQFLDYVRALNKAYINGLISYNSYSGIIDFSTYGGCFDFIEGRTDLISTMAERKISDDFIKNAYYSDPEKFKEFSYPKAYTRNRSVGSTTMSAFSEHKEQVTQLFKAICNDPDCAQALENIGIYRPLSVMDAESYEKSAAEEGLTLSPVLGYKVSYADVSEYSDIKVALYSCYDDLCHAEDFDAKLEEINASLKEMGIDEFVDAVNASLVKNGFMPS